MKRSNEWNGYTNTINKKELMYLKTYAYAVCGKNGHIFGVMKEDGTEDIIEIKEGKVDVDKVGRSFAEALQQIKEKIRDRDHRILEAMGYECEP